LKKALTIAALGLAVAGPARAELSREELAKLAQNPVGNLVSVPFQNNTNFNTGPLSGTQNILNIQPVVPFELNKDWNLITRTILPLVWQPAFYPGQGSRFGLGDLQLSGFVSPSKPGAGGLIWGAGAIGGAVVGNEVQKKHDRPVLGQQIIVRTSSGVLVSITQPASAGLRVGQRVYIEGGGDGARVVPQQ